MKVCNILGVNINCINMSFLINMINNEIDRVKGKYITICNVHTTIIANDDVTYRNIQNSAWLRLPDGNPLAIICKKKGYEYTERITGPDFMEEIFKESIRKGYRHFFYGSTDENLNVLSKKLRDKYKGINIVGLYSPPFRELSKEEDEKIINIINDSETDFIWVGLGAPKQEIWMYEHMNKVRGLMVGVGAGFDYHSGALKRAPKWMQKYSLEWLYRLIQEPRRLFKRYLITNFKFIYLILKKVKFKND